MSEDKKYYPYEEEVAIRLECALQANGFNRVEVSSKPLCFATKTDHGTFKQYQYTENAEPQQEKDVHRGWMGVIVKDGIEYKV